MIRNSIIILILVGVGYIFYEALSDYTPKSELGPVAEYYADNGAEETGAANLVTSVIVTYRGLDTLGEVTILFLTAAIIGLILKGRSEKKPGKLRPSSEILITAANVMLPIIFLFGIYIFINGHLTPGGGFQGGAVLATAVILLMLSVSKQPLQQKALDIVESISGFAFIFIGLLGIFLAAGFLDNRILPLGTFGDLFSAGAIPIIYSLIGLKVGAELSNIVIKLNYSQE